GAEDRHPDQERRGAHHAGEGLRAPPEGVAAQRVAQQLPPARRRVVERCDVVLCHAQSSVAASSSASRAVARAISDRSIWPVVGGGSSCSRQSSGSTWSSTSSTVTAPSSRPSSSITGIETRL